MALTFALVGVWSWQRVGGGSAAGGEGGTAAAPAAAAPAPAAAAPGAGRREPPPAFRALVIDGADIATTPERPAEKWQTYTVVPGDTLEGIARRFGLRIRTLEAANGLTRDSILAVGRELAVPSVDGVLHRVRSGDTLWDIALLYGADPEQVVEANADLEPGALPLGSMVLVPGGRPPERSRQLASRGGPSARTAGSRPAPAAQAAARGTDQATAQGAAQGAEQAGPGGGARLPVWPLRGRITSGFGWRTHPVYKTRAFHEGIDVAAPRGTPIVAAADGRVIRAARYGGYGLTVELDHGGGLVTRYSHASKLLVKVGDVVAAGQTVALVGSTGVSTGPHLDFGVIVNGRPRDPMQWLP